MNHPLRILQTLDRHLAAPAEINLFGCAALAGLDDAEKAINMAASPDANSQGRRGSKQP